MKYVYKTKLVEGSEVMADTDCASESASSVCDEERVRKLFQACDADGDGYIDSHDLLAVCRELSLEDSLDELMLQLGADAQGRISYEQFLQRRLALRPEIDALKGPTIRDTASENSQGKLDSWEWDSGARDLSPVPQLNRKTASSNFLEPMIQVLITDNFPLDHKYVRGYGRLDGHALPGYGGLYTISAPGVDTQERTYDEPCIGDDLPRSRSWLCCPGSHSGVDAAPPPLLSPGGGGPDKPLDVVTKAPVVGCASGCVLITDNFPLDHKYVRGYGRLDGHALPGYALPGYGGLYTISAPGVDTQERTYDEPCIGDDLPRSRSWLCCPGSHSGVEAAPPPLLSPGGGGPDKPLDVVTKAPVVGCASGCERVKQQLEEQAQRYEEQLTELHSVIAELTRKLHQQRSMAITEEDEASEICTSAHEDSITCPLEVSELEPLENDLSDTETKLPLAESPLELPDPKLNTSQHETNDIATRDEIDTLKSELQLVRAQLAEAQTKLAQSATPEPLLFPKTIETIPESPLENDEHLDNEESDVAVFLSDEKLNIKSSTIVPIHKSTSLEKKNSTTLPVAKMAERVRLRRATEDDRIVSTLELVNSGLSTAVAEHLVGDILRQCDQPEKQALEMELRRINAKLEHVKAQNTVLALTLSETKEHCDRLALLCGKYESNAIALRLALGISDRAIEAYDVLLALLETELTIDQNEQDTIENRAAAEGVAKQLLAHLDMHQSSDVLLSPWQHSIYPNSTTNSEPWTAEHETRLREHVSRLKQDRSSIQGTYVTLESTHVENFPRVCSTQESRKMDLEMAVLMQELMSLREDKAELLTKLFILEKDKGSTELKLKYVDGQQRAQAAALKNLQGQLKDTEALLVLATQNKERGYSDAEHAQGVELELMQALARESRLKLRLQELVSTLEQVTKNAEQRLLEGRELVHDLNQTNSVLVETVDRNYRKYQNRLKKMEHQMLTLVDRHSSQVDTLKQRIATLEAPVHHINSSGNSETSI